MHTLPDGRKRWLVFALGGPGVSVDFVSMLRLNASWFHERRFATVSGPGNTIGLTGALPGAAPLAAAHYTHGIALLAACALFGLVAALFIRESHCRIIWAEKTVKSS